MTAEQFAYWMQGFAELSPTPPTQEQWNSIREHVGLVFKKVTPTVGIDGIVISRQPGSINEMFDRLDQGAIC